MITASISIEHKNKGAFSRLFNNVRRALAGPKTVKVGFPAGKVDAEVMMRAAWMEFGTSRGIPERPFLRNAMRNNEGTYKLFMLKAGQKILVGQGSMKGELDSLGNLAKGHIQKSINSNTPPPLKPATIKKKGSSRTLVDSGEMRQSVTFDLD